MERRTALYTAGTLTGLVLFALLALGLGSRQSSAAVFGSPWQEQTAASAAVTPATAAGDVLQLEAENAQLRDLLTTMQQREAIYRQQLEKANRTLAAQQSATAEPPQASSAQSAAGDEGEWNDDDDNDDNDEDEHKEHEEYEERDDDD